MKKAGYKNLDQLLVENEERVSLSTRVKKNTKSFLDSEAKARHLTVSSLAAAILDDYANTFLKKKKGK
ncbi:MAG: hypothetical protein COW01_06125 [Bdellovibrionales bacterium CG12_big_fil_rev_8_21_14_0_65_38_15]|nr:MAG: hypothetical protein COW79_04020 [Bdellovibrionales bacterium CG22_combo_CG10-13_8_21_14_all_38_13]PIQ56005.1 MAG: hypothetical protein COW01_06125 [Bdellovibrionales bacterium CG12_big_fil_rev_8_21_14_0_65_38_15]PIR30610.1 MAG: hypothetical protein COV38_04665 [Bdellovibrionales bacterium CG11_big_fil_rev_8_21_14_0_20_38_13]